MPAKFKRGDVVLRPDSWAPRGKSRRGRAIVMKAGATKVVLCTFQPGAKIGPSNPHLGVYAPSGLVAVGHVKKMPKVCVATLKSKEGFWKQYPYFATPRALKGAKRRRRRR